MEWVTLAELSSLVLLSVMLLQELCSRKAWPKPRYLYFDVVVFIIIFCI